MIRFMKNIVYNIPPGGAKLLVAHSLLSAPLAVHVHAGCSTFPFYTLTNPLIQLHIKYKSVLFPKL